MKHFKIDKTGFKMITAILLCILLVFLFCYSYGQTKCFLIGTQTGWKVPQYEITTDSLHVDSLFRENISDIKNPWEIMDRHNCVFYQTSKRVFYVEAGTYTLTAKGRKHFHGLSQRQYLKKRFK